MNKIVKKVFDNVMIDDEAKKLYCAIIVGLVVLLDKSRIGCLMKILISI